MREWYGPKSCPASECATWPIVHRRTLSGEEKFRKETYDLRPVHGTLADDWGRVLGTRLTGDDVSERVGLLYRRR